FASETLETIQRAFRHASRRRHDTVGLEHLLLSITEEPTARQQLGACDASRRASHHATRPLPAPAGLEHLLLSITEEPTARQQLAACGADLPSLRQSVTDVLERAFVPMPRSASVEPEPTVAFD